MAQLHAQPFEPAPGQGQGGEEVGVAVALDDLGGMGLHLEAQEFAGDLLHPGVQIGVGAHRAGDLAVAHVLQGLDKALPVPGELGVEPGHLEPEADGLGVDAVGAAHAEQALVLEGQGLERGQEPVETGQDHGPGLGQQHAIGRVGDVRGGAAQVDEAGRGPHLLLHCGEKGDDVVPGALLDLQDAVEVEAGLGADGGHVLGRDAAQAVPGLAHRDLHVEPGLELGLQGPDSAHLRAGVAFDHGPSGGLGRPGAARPKKRQPRLPWAVRTPRTRP